MSLMRKKVMVAWDVERRSRAWFPATVIKVVSNEDQEVEIDFGDQYENDQRYFMFNLYPDKWWKDVLVQGAWWIPNGHPEY